LAVAANWWIELPCPARRRCAWSGHRTTAARGSCERTGRAAGRGSRGRVPPGAAIKRRRPGVLASELAEPQVGDPEVEVRRRHLVRRIDPDATGDLAFGESGGQRRYREDAV